MSNIIISKVPTKTVIRNGKVVQEHVYPPSAEGTLFADIPYNKFAGGGNIPDGDEPERQEKPQSYNDKYDGADTRILSTLSPKRRTMPPEDYRFVDSNTYKITHPEKWYGYQGGTKLDNKWYWQRKDGKWVDEDNNVIGYYLGMPGARSQTLSVKEHNKKVNEFLQRIPSHVKNVFNVSGIGPLIEEHIRKQLEQIQEGEMPEVENTSKTFISTTPFDINTAVLGLNSVTPLQESISNKKLLNDIYYNGSKENYEALYNQVPRPAEVYTEDDFSENQLNSLDSLVRNSFKRHKGFYPNVLLGDTLKFDITSKDYEQFLGSYGKDSGFWGTLKRSFNPLGSVETTLGQAPVSLYSDGYTIGGDDGNPYDFNIDQGNGYSGDKQYGRLRMWAGKGGPDSRGAAETDTDHDIFKQRFLIRRKFNNKFFNK